MAPITHPPIANRIACIDFDGTIVKWQRLDIEPSEAIVLPGAKAAITRIKEAGYNIVIFTSRMSGTWLRAAKEDPKKHADFVREVLDMHGIPWDHITAEKVPAEFYIDDHAVEFTGNNWRSIANRVERAANA